MTDPVEHHSVRRMLEHQGWVRDLARQLVRDPGLAEDVAQEAWVAALEHPPVWVRESDAARNPGAARRWLGAVTRNAARQLGRSESRRADRERRAAREDRTLSPAELLERAQLQRRVAEAVEHLAEPYRSTLFLRFLEEFPPREIARRQGVPVETVRTRIGRGLELLRSRLDDEFGGDRRAWMAALTALVRDPGPVLPIPGEPGALSAPAVPVAPLSPFSIGAALVNTKLVLSLVGISVLGLGAWYATRQDTAPAEPVVHAAPESEPRLVAPPAASPAAAVAAEATRTVADVSEPAATAVQEPAEAGLLAPVAGRVLDADGRGLAGVELALTSFAGEALGRTSSGAAGRFALETAADRGSLAANDADWTTVLASSWSRDQEREPLVIVAPRTFWSGRVVDPDGAPIPGAQVSVGLPRTFRSRLELVLDRAERRNWVVHSGEDGGFELDAVPLIADAAVSAWHADYLPFSAPLEEQAGAYRVIALARPEVPENHVGGVVLDPLGAPVEGAFVALGLDTDRTGPDGTFGLRLDERGWLSEMIGHDGIALTAVKAGFLPATFEPPVSDDGSDESVWPRFVTLTLGGEPLALSGAVLDHRGEPLPNAIVWLADPTVLGEIEGSVTPVEHVLADSYGTHWETVPVDARGEFRLEGLLERDYLVRAMDPETLVHAEFGPFAAGSEVELALPTDRVHPHVTGRVLTLAGEPVPGVAVYPQCDPYQSRVGGQVIGTSHQMLDGVTTDAEGRFDLENVPETLVYLRVQGEGILPLEFGRAGPGGAGEPEVSGLPGESVSELEITVLRRAHLQVELRDPAAADQVAVLDAGGERVMLNVLMARSRYSGYELQIREGRTDTLALPETGEVLVLLKDGVEIGRLPLELMPGEVTSVVY